MQKKMKQQDLFTKNETKSELDKNIDSNLIINDFLFFKFLEEIQIYTKDGESIFDILCIIKKQKNIYGFKFQNILQNPEEKWIDILEKTPYHILKEGIYLAKMCR